nr:hypothetical protein [Vitreimonas sp.]
MRTVELQHQLALEADEVGDINAERDLAAKLEVGEAAVAQQHPKDALFVAHVAAKAAGALKRAV